MASTLKMATLVVIALCISSLLSLTNAGANINGYITGKVVCDPCVKGGRAIKSAQIMIICFDKTTNAGTYARKGITDNFGIYRIAMKPGIEKDNCEVRLHKNSPWKKCRHIVTGFNVTTVDFSHTVGQANNKPLYGAYGIIGYKKTKSLCK